MYWLFVLAPTQEGYHRQPIPRGKRAVNSPADDSSGQHARAFDGEIAVATPDDRNPEFSQINQR